MTGATPATTHNKGHVDWRCGYHRFPFCLQTPHRRVTKVLKPSVRHGLKRHSLPPILRELNILIAFISSVKRSQIRLQIGYLWSIRNIFLKTLMPCVTVWLFRCFARGILYFPRGPNKQQSDHVCHQRFREALASTGGVTMGSLINVIKPPTARIANVFR